MRALAEQLGTTLNAITADDVNGQALAAAALFSANVTPVVTIHIGFGGDNHTDANLQAEADQHVSGVRGIQQVMNALGTLTDAMGVSLTERVTFATMNVFGRNLSGIQKVIDRTGRDHYGNHSVMVMIGKNVKPGVIGGVIPNSTTSTTPAYAGGRHRRRDRRAGDRRRRHGRRRATPPRCARWAPPSASLTRSRPAITRPAPAARSSRRPHERARLSSSPRPRRSCRRRTPRRQPPMESGPHIG